MTDLQKLFFEDKATVSEREVLVTARLNGRIKGYVGRPLTEEIFEEIKAAIANEIDLMVQDRVIRRPIDWLAVMVKRRLYVAYGSRAVQQLSRELKDQGLV